MARIGPLALLCAAVLLYSPADLRAQAASGKEPDGSIDNYLTAQMAMLQGEMYLLQRQPAKAVEVLEAPLKRVNVNRKYLNVLREAYRAYIIELCAGNQQPLAQTFESRLRILDGQALKAAPPPASTAAPVNAPPTNAALAGNLYNPVMPAAKPQGQMVAPATGTTKARAKLGEDPFDASNQQKPAALGERTRLAQSLVGQAEAEYNRKRYTEARGLYERAHQADAQATQECRERWAYCKLQYVVDQINQAGPASCAWPELQREVQFAVAMAPGLARTGQWLLGQIEGRRGAAAPAGAALNVAVQHAERNAQGWQVAETRYFRVFHNQSRDLAEKVAHTAEQTRLAMSSKWFGGAGEDWRFKCEIYLHASAEEYHKNTGAAVNSPGHSRIETDPTTKQVVGRRIHLHCDSPEIVLNAVLPHETTHAVLAGQFGGHVVPRWADEGMAVLSEPVEKRTMHRRNLARSSEAKELFGARQLMEMKDYPPARQISAFYAQSVSLVEFLSKQRGPVTFARFLRDGLREGYEPALRKHYNYRDFNELQNSWNRQVAAELEGVAGNYAER